MPRCLGCGITIKSGNICYRCLDNGLVLTQIYNKTRKSFVITPDGKEHSI